MNNNNNNNNTNTTTGYRPIAPSPSSTIINPMIPISPHHSPLSRPSPQQHGILPPPMSFRTPPVSPFSLPINMNPEYLPPPLQLMSMTSPPSPTNGRYEQRILPKQQSTPSTSVFSVPMTPSNASSVMQHHNSVIHPSYQQQRLGGAATGGTNGDKQLTTADQRELARKVSHSAIERRRRERINDKILQLKELIPSCADQDHLHKLSILQSAIEYIQYLQGCVAESRKREGNNNGNSDERYTKRSKFDRYEIPIPKHLKDDDSDKTEYKRKNSSGKLSDSDGENSVTSTRVKKATADASTNTDIDSNKSGEEEEANTLLLLSKSTSTDDTNDNNNNDKNTDNNNNNKEIPKTRSVEVQTSPNTNEVIEIEEEQKEEPRRVSVQQLCN